MKKFRLKIKPKVTRNYGGLSFGHLFSKIIYVIIAFLILQGSLNLSAQSPLAANGKLSVNGTQLVNKNGTAIQLRGMSSHGTQWYTEDYNFNSLSVLVNKWGIDLFRIAMYPTDKPDATKNAYEGNPTFWKGYVDNLVDICGKLGVYSIIDWHVLTPGDPNDPTYLPMAKEFWDYMSKKHAGKNQVMYEICNEPNGITWATVKAYANIIIPIIRANDPNSIIIVGSPTWSSDVDIAATDPIKDPVNATKLASNVMYSFHFYAASHGQNYRDKITAARAKGLPIFVTEWGSTDASGGGTSNWTETQTWMDFLATNKISWANWSYSDKSETSAVLQPGSGALLLWDNTNAQGDKIKILIATPADSWISTGNWSPAVTISSPLIGDYFLPGTKVTLTATPVDKDGTIASVDFLVDGVKIGTATAAPFSFQWTPATVKDYVVTAVAKDNAGATGTSTPFTYHVVASINETAYPSGTAWPVPGDIACMNFDNGGEMIAYHDLDAVHKGPSGSSRPTEGVDVEGSANIGYVLTGEWLKYTVNVASAGTYDFTLQTASGLPGTGKFHLESNGVTITAITDVPSSGSWASYQPVVVKGVPLNAGIQVIKLYIDCGNFNFSTMNFKLTGSIIYSITASAGTGGTISPTGKVTLAAGVNQTFTISPVLGNKVTDVTIDGTSVGAVTTYTFTNLAANHTIAATFSPVTPTYTITASAVGTCGAISPSGSVVVNSGATQMFTITVSSGCKICDVIVDGVSVGAVTSYTFTNVIAKHKIEVIFCESTYTITASAGTGGTISPSGSVVVNSGANQSFAIAASSGYKISDVTVDGVSQSAIATYTFTNVLANHIIAASFVPDQGCNLLTLFGVPRTSVLPTIANKSFTHAYVLGTGGPSLSNVTSFTINWDLHNNGLYQFSFNTNNGMPSWWIDLLPKIVKSLNVASPSLKITGSGISGLDDDYWVNYDGTQFIMVAKSGSFAIVGSSSSTPPAGCSGLKSAKEITNVNSSEFSIYPNPVDENGSFNIMLKNIPYEQLTISIIDLNGRKVISKSMKHTTDNFVFDYKLSKGVYIITLESINGTYFKTLIVK
jgi:Cellulase (glycosyl hydrolase family 5)/Carbohydrate binding module (family 6)/Bacterial Ig domain/Secretion system C-terminal sorting domain